MINNEKYNYNRDNLCLCYECYNKIYTSKYVRVCENCENKFEYFYNFYILQRIETPSLCPKCEKIKINDTDSKDLEDPNPIEDNVIHNPTVSEELKEK